MRLVMETPVKIANGRSATIVHDEEGRAHLFYEADKLMWAHTEVPLGIWDGSVRFINAIPIAPDDDVSNLHVHYLPEGKMWFVWKNGDTHRFAVHKDDGPQHELTSPYRLYYAVDTEKLYMNISETWQFIGSPNIANLVGYEEIARKLDLIEDSPTPGTGDLSELIARIEALEAAMPSHSLDMEVSHKILLGNSTVSSMRTAEVLRGFGHQVDTMNRDVFGSLELDHVVSEGYELVIYQPVGDPNDPSNHGDKLMELMDNGIPTSMWYCSNETAMLDLGIVSLGSTAEENRNHYVVGDHAVIGGLPKGHWDLSIYKEYLRGEYIGRGLIYNDLAGTEPELLVIPKGTESLTGYTFPLNFVYAGILRYADENLYVKALADRIVRWSIQSNRRG